MKTARSITPRAVQRGYALESENRFGPGCRCRFRRFVDRECLLKDEAVPRSAVTTLDASLAKKTRRHRLETLGIWTELNLIDQIRDRYKGVRLEAMRTGA